MPTKFVRFDLLLIFLIAFISCVKNPSSTDVDAELEITSISSQNLKGGDTLKIIGKNLLKDMANTKVLLNGNSCPIILFTQDSIKAKVPLMAGSGNVVIHTGNKEYVGPTYTYDYKVTVTTIAGSGAAGNWNGPAMQASFNCPWGITISASGDLFIADVYNRLIRKIAALDQTVSSFSIPTVTVGENFYSPYNIAIDTATGDLFVTDFNKHVMRMDQSGEMTLIHTGIAPLSGIAVNSASKEIFVANNSYGTIIKMSFNGGNVVTFTNNLVTPRNIFFNQKGQMFVTAYPGPIYEIKNTGQAVNISNDVSFGGWEAVVDTAGNFFLADHFSNCIRIIEKSGKSKIIAGSGAKADIDGVGLEAAFDGPQGITIDAKGHLYVTTYNYDRGSGNKVRKVVIE
jgi:DNA-binding beta-propeller fold protein YncE